MREEEEEEVEKKSKQTKEFKKEKEYCFLRFLYFFSKMGLQNKALFIKRSYEII